jgi:integrase
MKRNNRTPTTDVDVPDFDRLLPPILALACDEREATIARYLMLKAETQAAAVTYAGILRRILRWFAARKLPVLAATRDDVVDWWATTRGLAPSTRASLLAKLRAMYAEARRRKMIADDPTEGIAMPRRESWHDTPALTLDQFRRLLASLVAELGHPERGLIALRDLAIIALMSRLCLRCNEVHWLRWKYFTVRDERPIVDFTGKFHKRGVLYVPDDVDRTLFHWRSAYERQVGVEMQRYDPLFVGLSPAAIREARARKPGRLLRPLTRVTLYLVVTGRLRDIGISGDRFSPHCLRATGATLAFEGGADLVEVQALLRHASVETTRKFYVKHVDQLAQPAMDKMPFRFEAGQ